MAENNPVHCFLRKFENIGDRFVERRFFSVYCLELKIETNEFLIVHKMLTI